MGFVEKQLTTIVTPNHLCALPYTEIKQELSVQLNQTAVRLYNKYDDFKERCTNYGLLTIPPWRVSFLLHYRIKLSLYILQSMV